MSTETEPRITELDEIPSPYLANLFDGDYRMAVIETNRGCPYSCGFCYWGAANNSRIHRFDEQRIRDEITWISEHGIPIVYIADANWGILKRDVGLSEHFVECKEKNAHPLAVIFSTAKNKPERVSEITKHFGDHGMISTQTISMQSLDETALDRIDRKNIKLSNFAEVQADLNKNGIGSYIELIWPLPGETLTSFKQGLQTLCERDASTVIVYAHMLLHNTPVWEAQAEHGIETHVVMDDSAEMEMVVRTNEVSREEYDDGLWFIYAMSALHNCRTLQTLDAYLFQVGITDYQTIFTEFGEFLRDEKGFALSEFCHDSVRTARFYEFTNFPTLYHLVMHEDRVGFANLLRRYLESKSWWADENVQFLFELDMVLRPLLYRNTNLDVADLELNHLRVVETSTEDSFYDVEVPGRFAELVTHYLPKPHAVPETTNGLILRIDHRKTQFSHLESRSPNDAADYRNGIITRMATVLPSVTGTELASSRLSIRSAGRKLLQLSETARSSKR